MEATLSQVYPNGPERIRRSNQHHTFIGIPHIGESATLDRQTLPMSYSFRPTSPDRTTFFVKFWNYRLNGYLRRLFPGSSSLRCISSIMKFRASSALYHDMVLESLVGLLGTSFYSAIRLPSVVFWAYHLQMDYYLKRHYIRRV
jgi:hypothetical protein